jgi:hypothetical protein
LQLKPTLEVKGQVQATVAWLQGYVTMLTKSWEQLAKLVNGQVSFGNGVTRDNIQGNWFIVTTPGTPNTDFVVNHNLGYIPVGVLVMGKGASVDVYNSPTTVGTPTQITLRATVASVVVRLFIL